MMKNYWLLRSYFQSIRSEIEACEIFLERWRETGLFPNAIPFTLKGVIANVQTCIEASNIALREETERRNH